MKYTTINIQGNLISEEILQKVERGEALGQKPTDFGFEPGSNIRSEIEYAWSRIKLDWKHFSDKSQTLPASDPYGTTLSRKWMEQFLSSLGFELSKAKTGLQGDNNQNYTISHIADNLSQLPVHLVGFIEPNNPDKNTLDIKTSGGTSRFSPHATMQEYLNVTEHVYGIAANGLFLRLIRDSGRLIKLTYVEFDLKRMLDEDKYSEFTLLYRLLHATRFPRTQTEADQCFLEKYYQESIETGNRIRDGLSLAVKESLVALGNGLLNQPENESLRAAYQNGQLSTSDFNHQLLRLIYRLLFLIVTEERDLIFDKSKETEEQKRNREIYYRYYSLVRIRKLSATRYFFEPQFTDLWQGLMQSFSFFEPGNKGLKLGIHPLGGELFQPSAIWHIRESLINNRVLLDCIKNLNEFEDAKKNRVLINFRSLDVEELGSIYEGLLDLSPVINPDGRHYIFTYEKGTERSSSGSHYTPEDLVKPLIQHSLEYLIDERVQPYYKGKTTAEAAIQSLLNLKVADVACGSGHILLSAARRVAHEVARIESGEQQPNPESFRKALKQVIRHCIYGVDKNPLAVELCKVALWLESHNPGEPLNFLDHHIKCGDAIVGLAHMHELENGIPTESFKTLPGDDKAIASTFRRKNIEEKKFADVEKKLKAHQVTLDTQDNINLSLKSVRDEYSNFLQLPETTPQEIEQKADAYRKWMTGARWMRLQTLANMQIAQFFIPKTEANKTKLITESEYRRYLYSGTQISGQGAAKANGIAAENRFFHWFLEFPEVFREGGFDCVLGNPPFLNGLRLSTHFGNNYFNFLATRYSPCGGTCDLVAYFFRRNFSIIKLEGFLSLISTNTISQGDTREGALDFIVSNHGVINFAVKSIKWPGKANLEVSLVSINNKRDNVHKFLNKEPVTFINSFLSQNLDIGLPYKIEENKAKCFVGSYVLGKGYVMEPSEAEIIISSDPIYKDVLFPYLNGDDLNNNKDQNPSRFVINFHDWNISKVEKYIICFNILLKHVKPERDKLNRKSNRDIWWQYAEKRPGLYSTISSLKRVIAVCRVTKYLNFAIVPKGWVYDTGVNIIANDTYSIFSILSSTIHEVWARKYASSLETRLRYTNEDCFETFPFPHNSNSPQDQQLEIIGESYHEHRRHLMLGMLLGLTKTYNLFHSNAITAQAVNEKDKQVIALQKHLDKTANTISFDKAIQGILKLRDLHVQMDEAVLDAYGWNDIALKHDFYEVDYLPENDRIRFTIHPEARKEVLKRLLELNHKIHEEEVAAGLWEKKKITTQKKNTTTSAVNEPQTGYMGLFKEQEKE